MFAFRDCISKTLKAAGVFQVQPVLTFTGCCQEHSIWIRLVDRVAYPSLIRSWRGGLKRREETKKGPTSVEAGPLMYLLDRVEIDQVLDRSAIPPP
jgi:hypothetical protein